MKRLHIQLYFTGFVQVYFVSVNTYLLSREMYAGVFFAAFMISIIWSWNVRKVAFGSTRDRIVYAIGAASGSVIGLLSSTYIVNIF